VSKPNAIVISYMSCREKYIHDLKGNVPKVMLFLKFGCFQLRVTENQALLPWVFSDSFAIQCHPFH